jgi:hypothetical protein
MMRFTRLAVLPLIFAMLSGCGAHSIRAQGGLPEQRTGDFTFGLVVFGGSDDSSPQTRSARYIIEPGGEFRASFGEGSTGITYPPMTRRLDRAQLEDIWEVLESIELDSADWQPVRAPEIYHHELGSARGYLLELKVKTGFRAWSTPIESQSARALAERLAALAWVQD